MERIKRQLEEQQQAQQNNLIKEYKDNKHNLQQEIRTDIKRIASQYPGFKKYALYQIYKQFHFNRNIANEFISIQIKNDEEAQEDGWIEVGKANVRIRSHSHNSQKIEQTKRDSSVPKRRPSAPKQKKFAVVYVPKTPTQIKFSPTKRGDRAERSDRSDRFERFDRQITPPQKQRLIIEYVPKSSVEQKHSSISEQTQEQQIVNKEQEQQSQQKSTQGQEQLQEQEQEQEQEKQQEQEQEQEKQQEQQDTVQTEQDAQFDLSKQQENYIKELLKDDNNDQSLQAEQSIQYQPQIQTYQPPIQPFQTPMPFQTPIQPFQTPIQPFQTPPYSDVNYQPYYFYQNFEQEQSQLYHILLGYVKNQDLTN